MLIRCAKAVRAAAQAMGKPRPTDAQLKAIDERMAATMRQLAKEDPKWASYSREERMRLAAERAASDIRAEAAAKAAAAREYVLAQVAAAQRASGVNAREIASQQADLQALEARMAALSPSPELAALAQKLAAATSVQQLKAAYETARAEHSRLAQTSKLKRKLQANFETDRKFADLMMMAAEHRLRIAQLQLAAPAAAPGRPSATAATAPRPTLDEVFVSRLAVERPDMEVILPGGERSVRVSEAVTRIQQERQQDLQWASLVRAAAECALTAG